MKPLTPEFFQTFWDLIEKTPMTDLQTSEYATWENEHGVKYEGMKHNETG